MCAISLFLVSHTKKLFALLVVSLAARKVKLLHSGLSIRGGKKALAMRPILGCERTRLRAVVVVVRFDSLVAIDCTGLHSSIFYATFQWPITDKRD